MWTVKGTALLARFESKTIRKTVCFVVVKAKTDSRTTQVANSDSVQYSGMRAHRNGPTTRPGITTKVKAGDQYRPLPQNTLTDYC